ncbi:MAG: ATP-binding protein [Myxococcaceae bacterium]
MNDARLGELVDVLVAIAAHDFGRRAGIGDGSHPLDGLAAGLNMLSEEIANRVAREREFQERLTHNERLMAVGQLAAGVAHEINNPAAFIKANLEVLSDHLDHLDRVLGEADVTERARTLEVLADARAIVSDNLEGVARIVEIVRNLRNFSRSGPTRLESLDLATVLEDGCRLVRAEVAHRAELIVEPAPEVRVRGDRTRLAQVLTNLLVNATHAIPEGNARAQRVVVSARIAGEVVIISVTDTGRGISSDLQARIFEPFFTTKARDQGTGLGLTISAEIARSHGGILRLARSSPAGTTFELELPIENARVTPLPAVAAGGSANRGRVMIIDDEGLLLRAYDRALSPNFELVLCDGFASAVSTLSTTTIDLIICDVMMPDRDGVDFHDWVSRHRPDLVARVFYSTGGAFAPRAQDFIERLGKRVLAKPLTPELVASMLDQVREGRPISSK